MQLYKESLGNYTNRRIADTTLLENIKMVKPGGKLKYHSKCKNNIYNTFAKITKQSKLTSKLENELAKIKKTHTCVGAISSQLVRKLYKNVCIPCNQSVHL